MDSECLSEQRSIRPGYFQFVLDHKPKLFACKAQLVVTAPPGNMRVCVCVCFSARGSVSNRGILWDGRNMDLTNYSQVSPNWVLNKTSWWI